MGDFLIIRQAGGRACTGDLDQLGELAVKVGERVLENFAVTRICGSFELLQHVLAR